MQRLNLHDIAMYAVRTRCQSSHAGLGQYVLSISCKSNKECGGA